MITSLLQEEIGDLSRISEEDMQAIKKNIRLGAKDTSQRWSNALHLVQQAYRVASVDRPSPEEPAAWKQYEENIAYAVQMLSKYRGVDGDWRMSSSIFHEDVKVTIINQHDQETYKVQAIDIPAIQQQLSESNISTEIIETQDNITLLFNHHDCIRDSTFLKITKP